jgi:WD40-like Beta Propeller Repeat
MLTAHGTRPPIAGMVLLLAAWTNSPHTRAPASPETPASTSPAGSGPIDLSSLNGRIAFSAGPARAEDIYVVKADGTGLRQVTSDPTADFDPTQSPDGKQIAYRHQIGGDRSTDIYVVDADGSGERNVSRNEGVADWGAGLGRPMGRGSCSRLSGTAAPCPMPRTARRPATSVRTTRCT